MDWNLHDLNWIEPFEISKEYSKSVQPEQQKVYLPTRDEIVAATRPYVAKPLWPAFDKIVTENASLGDILQRVKDEDLVSEYAQIPFEKDLRKVYQKTK